MAANTRTVFGRTVVADEPTPSPISTSDGQPIMWTQTRTLTLDDGTVAYGCAHCDYVSWRATSIRPHLNKHNRTNGTIAGTRLAHVARQLATVDQITADRDQWRARARRAEGALAKLRDALGIG